MNSVHLLRDQAGLTQVELASVGGTSQPTIAAYEAGRKSPTLQTLQRLAGAVGLEATVKYHPPLTREERRSLLLHRAIARRLKQDPERVLKQARRALRRMRARNPQSPLLSEWRVLLARPVAALLPLLTDPDPWARELRQVTPFAGVLSANERAAVYRQFAQGSEPAS